MSDRVRTTLLRKNYHNYFIIIPVLRQFTDLFENIYNLIIRIIIH